MIKNQPEIIWTPKNWGGEKLIDNTNKYCGKILYFIRGKKLSVHYHEIKMETFYILSGSVKLKYHDDPEELQKILDKHGPDAAMGAMETVILGPDETFFVPPRRVHQIIALVDSQLIEISTTHFDSDSYRIIKGD